MPQVYPHEPVMVDEVVALFAPVPAGVVVDATAGAGGHAAAVLDAHPHLRVLCLDRDADAVATTAARLSAYGNPPSSATPASTVWETWPPRWASDRVRRAGSCSTWV